MHTEQQLSIVMQQLPSGSEFLRFVDGLAPPPLACWLSEVVLLVIGSSSRGT